MEKRFFLNLAGDQRHIWTSPFRLRGKDAFWLIPSVVATGTVIHFDPQIFANIQQAEPGARNHRLASDAGLFVLGGTVGGMYFLGRIHGNDHLRETGVLGTQALVNTLGVTYAAKYALGRQRPDEGTLRGDFFRRGESFPSVHASSAWALASVVAHEYPGVLTRIGVYGMASAVSITRATGRRHFPSDVLVGSALGWAVGRMVYRRHHEEQAALDASVGKIVRDEGEPLALARFGSPYLPLDHWAYAAFDRLQGLGALRGAFLSMRPWTRLECARAVQEVEEALTASGGTTSREVDRLVEGLRDEFKAELGLDAAKGNHSAYFESLYVRATGITGRPLTDDYHFGRTFSHDFGRPFAEGGNAIAGFSAAATAGRWAVYVRGEYQHAAADVAETPLLAAEIARADNTPLQPVSAARALNRARLLDAYVAVNVWGWQLSAGKQSLWWGPGESGSFMQSNNPEPFPMVRVSRTTATNLPSILALLGPWRAEGFLGQLEGHRFVLNNAIQYGPSLSRQPLMHGFKLNFKPTPNFDFGVSVTTIFAGPGVPFNGRTVLRSFGFSNTVPGEPSDPGDRRSGFDFRYRIPFLRDRLTLYNDSYAEDEISPLAFPRRSAMNPGLYLSRVPFLPKLDLRAEGFYTDLPNLRGNGFFYYNFRYQSGYTSGGNLMGHPVGRQGSGFKLQSTYWFAADKRVRVSYSDRSVSSEFITGGGEQKDLTLQAQWSLPRRSELSAQVQYENWRFPVLSPGPRNNVSAFIQITLRPGRKPR